MLKRYIVITELDEDSLRECCFRISDGALEVRELPVISDEELGRMAMQAVTQLNGWHLPALPDVGAAVRKALLGG